MITVRFTCPGNHSDVLKFKDMPKEEVERIVHLIDGTSPMYLFPPKDNDGSSIGKCVTCGKRFSSVIYNAPDDNPPNGPQPPPAPPEPAPLGGN